MDLLGIAVLLYLLATGAVVTALSTGVSLGQAVMRRPVMDVSVPRINPDWISGGPIEADEPETAGELKSHNGLLAAGAGVIVGLLLITGAILAAAVLFVVGAFTTGTGMSVFVSSFVVGGVFTVALVTALFTSRKAMRAAWRTLRGKSSKDDESHATKYVAVGGFWLFVLNGLACAGFVLFVAGLIRVL